MTFTFDGHEVEITLPSAKELPEDPDEWRSHPFSYSRLSVVSYRRIENDKPVILTVDVEDVDVAVFIPGRSSVPQKALEMPPTQIELFSEQQQRHLDSLVSRYSAMAFQAFDLWIRTVRWKADDYLIGLPEISGSETGWASTLTERSSRKRLYSTGHYINVPGQKLVTTEIWNELPDALSAGGPPVFRDLLYDARAHLERGDLQRALVDAAVSAETYLRTTLRESLPNGLSKELKSYINDANISQVLNRFFSELLDSDQQRAYKKIRKNLQKLFSDRNDILHSGRKENVTEEHCRRLIDSVRDLHGLLPD